MEPDKVIEIVGAVVAVYNALIYVLPPKKAKKLTKWAEKIKPFKIFFDMLANTKGGLSYKK